MSKLDPACQHVLEHDPVTHKAVQRILEGGGLVFLEQEVANPGKAVADNGEQKEIAELTGKKCVKKNN